jgi:hypothetical protein
LLQFLSIFVANASFYRKIDTVSDTSVFQALQHRGRPLDELFSGEANPFRGLEISSTSYTSRLEALIKCTLASADEFQRMPTEGFFSHWPDVDDQVHVHFDIKPQNTLWMEAKGVVALGTLRTVRLRFACLTVSLSPCFSSNL